MLHEASDTPFVFVIRIWNPALPPRRIKQLARLDVAPPRSLASVKSSPAQPPGVALLAENSIGWPAVPTADSEPAVPLPSTSERPAANNTTVPGWIVSVAPPDTVSVVPDEGCTRIVSSATPPVGPQVVFDVI